MSFDTAVRIAGIGLVCPAGTGAATSRQRMAAGEISITRHKSFFNRDFERQLSCPVEDAAGGADLAARIAALGGMALDDLFAGANAVPARFDRVVLLLCQDGELGAAGKDIEPAASALTRDISTRAQRTDSPAPPVTRFGASAEFANILADLTTDSEWQSALVLSADSLLPKQRLARLDSTHQLFSKQNPWGIIPSEAAIALQLIRSDDPSLPRLCAAATTQEPVGPDDDGPALFRGMSGALNKAIDKTAAQDLDVDIDRFWGDSGQSRYHASEQAHAVIRAGGSIRRETALQNPCRILGDCGAAAMALAFGLAASDRDQGGMTTAIVGTGHSSGTRGGIVIAHEPVTH